MWNPFRSKLAAGILGGLDDIFMKPGSKVLYLGAASGTSVSHVADVVGVRICVLFSGFLEFRLMVRSQLAQSSQLNSRIDQAET